MQAILFYTVHIYGNKLLGISVDMVEKDFSRLSAPNFPPTYSEVWTAGLSICWGKQIMIAHSAQAVCLSELIYKGAARWKTNISPSQKAFFKWLSLEQNTFITVM